MDASSRAVSCRKAGRMSDTISRQAAISICDNAIDLWNGQLGTGALVAVRDAIMALPSAQPERKRGKWLLYAQRDGIETGSECSQCGYHIFNTPLYGHNYCPNCGADMRGNEDE